VAWLFELEVLPKISGIYLINIETLFFFTLGCYLVTRIGFLERLIGLRASWFAAAILAGLVVLVRLAASEPLNKRSVVFLSGYTFFAFLFHYFPLYLVVVRISALIVPSEYAFYLNVPLAAVLVFAAAFVCDRYLNPLYRLLTGDRGPGKALGRVFAEGPR
jgi:hypothetical protein